LTKPRPKEAWARPDGTPWGGEFATTGVVELVKKPGEASYAHVRGAWMTVAEIRGRQTPAAGVPWRL